MVTLTRPIRTVPMPDDIWVALINDLIEMLTDRSHPKYDRAVGHLNAARAAVQELIDGY